MNSLIERLKRILKGGRTENDCVFIDAGDLQEAISALEAVPQWVKCSERMPNFNPPKMVLFQHEQGGVDTILSHHIARTQGRIVAWMEFAAPPKVEQEVK